MALNFVSVFLGVVCAGVTIVIGVGYLTGEFDGGEVLDLVQIALPLLFVTALTVGLRFRLATPSEEAL